MMDRRTFSSAFALFGAGIGSDMFAMDSGVEVLQLKRNGWMPNNEELPVLLYRKAFAPSTDMTSAMEASFERNGWPAQWRNGVYDFHHYHSTAHEVLGFAAGWGRLVLGGEGGHELMLRAGDVAVLPAGTGHCKLEASQDFLVVGAYPKGEHWDICRSSPDDVIREQMRHVPFPASDPISGAGVNGSGGTLVAHWRRS
jgi:uncharacterized protein YjlB